MDVTDEQWAVVRPLIPRLPRLLDGRGRPRVDDRGGLNCMRWILRTGAPWNDQPDQDSSAGINAVAAAGITGAPWNDQPDQDSSAGINAVVVAGIMGAPWNDQPDQDPSSWTCHWRFQEWVRTGVRERLLRALAQDLKSTRTTGPD
ncbi:transposase [Roseiflexus castenholzii]|uniref:transposase n=1 Tax=Roseiflexus castenholzii TaxID=120962 RepID=UPI003C7B957B